MRTRKREDVFFIFGEFSFFQFLIRDVCGGVTALIAAIGVKMRILQSPRLRMVMSRTAPSARRKQYVRLES